VKFTESHEWVEINDESGLAFVGITAHAQKELGEIVYIELPKVGTQVQAGEEVAVLESTKAAVDISSPVTGEVVSVNERAKENTDLVNSAPESEGWLFKIKVAKEAPLAELLDHVQYLALIR